MTYDTSWSLGVLIWLPIDILSIIGFTVLTLWIKKRYPTWGEDSGLGRAAMWCSFSLVIICIIGALWGFYPYKAEYHKWQTKGGVVEKIDSRIISASSSSMQTKFVVRFKGASQQYGCDDTRCAGIEEGDELYLSCKRAWQYTGTDGYDCRFVSTIPKES